jgi:hypothetical protein
MPVLLLKITAQVVGILMVGGAAAILITVAAAVPLSYYPEGTATETSAPVDSSLPLAHLLIPQVSAFTSTCVLLLRIKIRLNLNFNINFNIDLNINIMRVPWNYRYANKGSSSSVGLEIAPIAMLLIPI